MQKGVRSSLYQILKGTRHTLPVFTKVQCLPIKEGKYYLRCFQFLKILQFVDEEEIGGGKARKIQNRG